MYTLYNWDEVCASKLIRIVQSNIPGTYPPCVRQLVSASRLMIESLPSAKTFKHNVHVYLLQPLILVLTDVADTVYVKMYCTCINEEIPTNGV